MDKGYSITTKEHLLPGGALVANNASFINLPDLINYAILCAIVIQILYTLWKWRKEYVEQRDKLKCIKDKEV